MSSDDESGTPQMEFEQDRQEQQIADSDDENIPSDNEEKISKKRSLEESTVIEKSDKEEISEPSQDTPQEDEEKVSEPPTKKPKSKVAPFHINYEFFMSDEIAPRLKEILENCISLGDPFSPASGNKQIAGSAIAMWAFNYEKFREMCPNAPPVKPIKPQGMGSYKLAINFPNLTTPFGYSPYISSDGKVANSFSVNLDETPEAAKFGQFLHILEEVLIEKIHQKKEPIWNKAKLDVPVNVEDLSSPRSFNSFVRTKKSNEGDASFVVVPMKFEAAPLDNRFPKEKKDEWSALVTVFQDQSDGSVRKIASELRKHHGNKYSGPEGNRTPSDTEDYQQIIPERTSVRGIVELDKVYLSKLGCGNTLKVLFLRIPYDDTEERLKEMEQFTDF